MRICLISEFYPFHPRCSGGEFSAHNLAKNLVKLGHEVSVVTSKYNNTSEEEIIDNVKVFRLFKEGYGRTSMGKGLSYILKQNELFYLKSFLVINKFLKKNKFDCLQSHNITTLIPTIFVALKYKIPALAFINGFDITCSQQVYNIRKNKLCKKCAFLKMWICSNKNRSIFHHIFVELHNFLNYAISRFCINKYNKIITTCYSLKELINISGITNCEVLYNSYDDYFNDNLILPNISKYTGKSVLFISSDLSNEAKGYRTIISLAEEFKEVLFICVGEIHVQKSELNNIIYKGRLNKQQLEEEYLKTDVVIIPSKFPDPLPRVGIDALYYSKPIIGSNIGGIKELIEKGQNGYLADPNNFYDFKIKLRKILSDDDLLKSMGNKSKEIYNKKFNYDLFINNLKKIYYNIRGI